MLQVTQGNRLHHIAKLTKNLAWVRRPTTKNIELIGFRTVPYMYIRLKES